MATPITVLDSANISVTDNVYNVSISGSVLGQDDVNYLIASNYSFTGSLVRSTANGGDVGFGYGIAVAPTYSISHPVTYPSSSFRFYLNGVRLEDSEILSFSENLFNTNSTASFTIGYPLRSYDVVTAEGKFRI
jgi:hypothetical protein